MRVLHFLRLRADSTGGSRFAFEDDHAAALVYDLT